MESLNRNSRFNLFAAYGIFSVGENSGIQFLTQLQRKTNKINSPGRRQVCKFQRKSVPILQSHRGPGAVCPHKDTWSAGSPPGSAG